MTKNLSIKMENTQFEIGDTVRIVPDPLTRTVYGVGLDKAELEGQVAKIIRPLKGGDMWVETEEGEKSWVSIHCFELVKKIEEDKYYVRRYACQSLDFDAIDDGLDNLLDNGWGVCDKETLDTIVYFADSYPNAEDAAREACGRLNKDWKNKQNN